MSNEAQIIANRQNSQKSTGPRTAEGKAVVSKNAVKHGLFASEAVIKGENQADFDLYRDEILAELAPVGPMESMLAERVVSLSWRLKRVERIQNQAIDVMIARDGPSPLTRQLKSMLPKYLRDVQDDPRGAEPELVLGRAVIKDYANSRVLDRFLMYERRIEHSMFKTMAELQRLQLLRQIEEQNADQEEFMPTSPSLRDEAATRPAEQVVDLKKQSQFAPAQMGVNSFVGKDYESKPGSELRENKPNSNPISKSCPKDLPLQISSG